MRIRCLILALLVATAGCRGSETPAPPTPGGRAGATPAMTRAAAMDGSGGATPSAGAPQAPQAMAVGGVSSAAGAGAAEPRPIPVPGRKVVRNGSMTLEVGAVDQALQAIRSETTAAGGFVTSESQGRDEYGVRQGSVTCRVPAEKLDSIVAKLQGLGKPQSLSIQAEDITEQYFNLEIRLRNQQQLESRLLKLFDRPANKVTDLLEVEREVARVRGEIDQLEGRKRFWDSQVSLSTLTVELREPRPIISGEGGGIFDTLRRAFRSAGENLVATIAWFIAAAGVIIPAWIVLWVVWRLYKLVRRRARRTPA